MECEAFTNVFERHGEVMAPLIASSRFLDLIDTLVYLLAGLARESKQQESQSDGDGILRIVYDFDELIERRASRVVEYAFWSFGSFFTGTSCQHGDIQFDREIVTELHHIRFAVEPKILFEVITEQNVFVGCQDTIVVAGPPVDVTEQAERRIEHFRQLVDHENVDDVRITDALTYTGLDQMPRLVRESRVVIRQNADDVVRHDVIKSLDWGAV